MTLSIETKQVIKKYQRNAKDTGSSEVQIVLLTRCIQDLTQHLIKHPRDVHSRFGLIKKVSRRRKILSYLSSTNKGLYSSLIQSLGLRK